MPSAAAAAMEAARAAAGLPRPSARLPERGLECRGGRWPGGVLLLPGAAKEVGSGNSPGSSGGASDRRRAWCRGGEAAGDSGDTRPPGPMPSRLESRLFGEMRPRQLLAMKAWNLRCCTSATAGVTRKRRRASSAAAASNALEDSTAVSPAAASAEGDKRKCPTNSSSSRKLSPSSASSAPGLGFAAESDSSTSSSPSVRASCTNKYSNCLLSKSPGGGERARTTRKASSAPCFCASARREGTPSNAYKVPLMCVRTCAFGCSMSRRRTRKAPSSPHLFRPAALSVRFIKSAEANSMEKSGVPRVAAPLEDSKGPKPLKLFECSIDASAMRFATDRKFSKIQSIAPSSIILHCRCDLKESLWSAARQSMWISVWTGSRRKTVTNVAMQLKGRCTSADSISRRPTTSHAHTASTANTSSCSSASCPAVEISLSRPARARKAPKHANAAKNARRGRIGSSGKASRLSTARRTA
mmetsp:Transcript_155278/g.498188  ORF Transcript_155278/g.498188 Transcript_155278/m.498188 type:complete len:471 (+) Transcript_155278:382-1794(+)